MTTLPDSLKSEFWDTVPPRQYDEGRITDLGARLTRFMDEHDVTVSQSDDGPDTHTSSTAVVAGEGDITSPEKLTEQQVTDAIGNVATFVAAGPES